MKDWLLGKLEGFAGAEVSTRSLGLIRICASLIFIHEFCGLLSIHNLEGHIGAIICAWGCSSRCPWGCSATRRAGRSA